MLYLLRGPLRRIASKSLMSPCCPSSLEAHGMSRSAQWVPAAGISTSKKKSDVTITADQAADAGSTKSETVADTTTQKKWVSYGFDHKSEEQDILIRNGVMFWSVTMIFVVGSLILAYYPDLRFRDWSQREAYIRLAQREAQGLPPIDENLVPIENIVLPSEEELGDFEIII